MNHQKKKKKYKCLNENKTYTRTHDLEERAGRSKPPSESKVFVIMVLREKNKIN